MSKVAKQEYSKKSQRLKVIERKQVLLGRLKKSYTDALYYIHSRTFVPVIIPVEIGQKHRELHKKNVNKKEQKTTCTRNARKRWNSNDFVILIWCVPNWIYHLLTIIWLLIWSKQLVVKHVITFVSPFGGFSKLHQNKTHKERMNNKYSCSINGNDSYIMVNFVV